MGGARDTCGGEDKHLVQDFGGKTQMKETTWET
jgi:hypothetical protein